MVGFGGAAGETNITGSKFALFYFKKNKYKL